MRPAHPRASCRAAALSSLAALSLACTAPGIATRQDLNTALRPFGIESTIPTAALSVIKQSQRQGINGTFHTIVARDRDLHVMIEIISPMKPKQASSYAHWRKTAILSLYEEPESLYPGERALIARCPSDRKPRELTLLVLGERPSGLLANAAADFSFGACADSEVRQVGIYMPFYDEQSMTFFQFSVFEPLERHRRDSETPLLDFLMGLARRTPER